MTMTVARKPPTDGELFDLLCKDFGVGDWDESTGEPFWKWRANEVAKVKRVRQAREVTVEHLMMAAAYAKANGHDIRDATWLYRYIRPAIRAESATAGLEETRQLEAEISTAVSEAISARDTAWVARLTNANGTINRTEALNAWRHR